MENTVDLIKKASSIAQKAYKTAVIQVNKIITNNDEAKKEVIEDTRISAEKATEYAQKTQVKLDEYKNRLNSILGNTKYSHSSKNKKEKHHSKFVSRHSKKKLDHKKKLIEKRKKNRKLKKEKKERRL